MSGTPVETFPVRRSGHAVVYFDAAWASRETSPPRAAVAFVIPGTPYTYGGAVAGDATEIVTNWDLRVDKIVPGGKSRLSSSEAGVRGIQLFDLLAAWAGVVHLRHNDVSDPVLFCGDNQGLIDFMRFEGELNIDISGQNIAPALRSEILGRSEGFSHTDWLWVPREDNLAADQLAHEASDALKRMQPIGQIFRTTFRHTPREDHHG